MQTESENKQLFIKLNRETVSHTQLAWSHVCMYFMKAHWMGWHLYFRDIHKCFYSTDRLSMIFLDVCYLWFKINCLKNYILNLLEQCYKGDVRFNLYSGASPPHSRLFCSPWFKICAEILWKCVYECRRMVLFDLRHVVCGMTSCICPWRCTYKDCR